MKLVVLCLLAVCCCSLTNTLKNDIMEKKLTEVLRQLKDVKGTLQHSELTLHTPPQNIEDCCCLSALKCFQKNLKEHFNISNSTNKKLRKFSRSIMSNITEKGLDLCESGTAVSTCTDCYSHPKENAREFFNRLVSLIQRAISRRNEN